MGRFYLRFILPLLFVTSFAGCSATSTANGGTTPTGGAPVSSATGTTTTNGTPVSSATGTTTTKVTPVPTASPRVSPPTAAVPLTATPGVQPASATNRKGTLHIQVLAHGFGDPDDILALPDGRLLFSDFGNRSINVIQQGRVRPLVGNIADPEGMALLPDGRLIIVEQATNRLLQVHLPAANVTGPPLRATGLRQLVNETNQLGVDNITYNPHTGRLLVPDSPNGWLLAVSLDGTKQQVLASGFVRPVGAAIERDGSLVVADEYGNQVVLVHPDGRRQVLATIHNVDDVALDQAGNILAIGLGDGILWQIDAGTGRVHTIASGLSGLQGLDIGPDGSVYVVESTRNQILRLTWK